MTFQKYQKGLHTVYRLEAKDEGVKVLILGAIHGNEPCGTIGIHRFLDSLETPLKNGIVTFIPICNPKAYEEGKRFHNEDLNRSFCDDMPIDSYEQDLVVHLKQHIDEHDILLDIHSYQGKTIPFILNDKGSDTNNEWVKNLHPEIVITGWDDIYPNGGDTNAYAHKMRKNALTVECGQHQDVNAPFVAQKIIIETLGHFNMIDAVGCEHKTKRAYVIKELIKKPSDEAVFTHDWQNFDPIDCNTPIYIDGENEFMWKKENSLIFMPKPMALKGKEWFYIIESGSVTRIPRK